MEEMNLFDDNKENNKKVYGDVKTYLEDNKIRIITDREWLDTYKNSNNDDVICESYMKCLNNVMSKSKPIPESDMRELVDLSKHIYSMLDDYDACEEIEKDSAVRVMLFSYARCKSYGDLFVSITDSEAQYARLCTLDNDCITFNGNGYVVRNSIFSNIVENKYGYVDLIKHSKEVLEYLLFANLVKCVESYWRKPIANFSTSDIETLIDYNNGVVEGVISEYY